MLRLTLKSRTALGSRIFHPLYKARQLHATSQILEAGTRLEDYYFSTSTMDGTSSVSQVCIRRIEESDVQRGFFEVLSQLTEAPPLSTVQFRKLVRAQRELDIQLTLVAVKNERVVGTGSVLIEPKFIRGGRPAGHIEDVVMDTSVRGKGVGKEIIHRLVSYAREKDCYKVVLDCGEYNVEFYQKCGLKLMGRQMAIYF